ncbi:MAG: RsmE family RNA methyltransferase [Pirellula staleyi]
MSTHRFLVCNLPNAGTVELPENEAHHASRVLRCSVQDAIVLFDGKGNEAQATIRSIDKRGVSASIDSTHFAPRDHNDRLHFAVALPKGDRQRSTIEKLVELGVDSLSPLETARSVAVVNESNSERLERYVVEACKQCRRNRLMSIHPTISVQRIVSLSNDTNIWILHPESIDQKSYSISQANEHACELKVKRLLFLVGPEGGFTDEEVRLAISQGARLLSFGERIQRVETAVSTAAVLGSCWLA